MDMELWEELGITKEELDDYIAWCEYIDGCTPLPTPDEVLFE